MFKVLIVDYIDRETMKIGKKNIKKFILITWIVGILLSIAMLPIADSRTQKMLPSNPTCNKGYEEYYNVSLFAISLLYSSDTDNNTIHLTYDSIFGLLPPPIGEFVVYNETGTLKYSRGGGWIHSIITIYNYEGQFIWLRLFKHCHFLYMSGNCSKICIRTYR